MPLISERTITGTNVFQYEDIGFAVDSPKHFRARRDVDEVDEGQLREWDEAVVGLTMFAKVVSSKDYTARMRAGGWHGVVDEMSIGVWVGWRAVANALWRVSRKTSAEEVGTIGRIDSKYVSCY